MEITVEKFDIRLVDEIVNAYIKTYAQEPWNESWESRQVVETFITNHYNNNYFRGFVAIADNRVVGVSLGFTKPFIKGLEY